MRPSGAAVTRVMSTGVLSAGWYSLLTGLAMLYVAHTLGSVPSEHDRAAPYVAAVLAVAGWWQLVRGLRSELQRRLRPTSHEPG